MHNLLPDVFSCAREHVLIHCRSSGAVLCIGGPYLIYYVSPTEEELFMVSFYLCWESFINLNSMKAFRFLPIC